MAAVTIVTRTIGGVEDRRANIQGNFIARQHGLGTTWNHIRVGIRFCANYTGVVPGAGAALYVGLCSGINNAVGSGALVVGFLGAANFSNAWTFTAAGGGNMAFLGGITGRQVKFINNVLTANNSGGANMPADPTTATRRVMIADITRGSPNFSISTFWDTGIVAIPDVLASDFVSLMTQNVPSFANHVVAGPFATAYNEGTNGVLDCVNVSWDTNNLGLEVCDVAAVVMS